MLVVFGLSVALLVYQLTPVPRHKGWAYHPLVFLLNITTSLILGDRTNSATEVICGSCTLAAFGSRPRGGSRTTTTTEVICGNCTLAAFGSRPRGGSRTTSTTEVIRCESCSLYTTTSLKLSNSTDRITDRVQTTGVLRHTTDTRNSTLNSSTLLLSDSREHLLCILLAAVSVWLTGTLPVHHEPVGSCHWIVLGNRSSTLPVVSNRFRTTEFVKEILVVVLVSC